MGAATIAFLIVGAIGLVMLAVSIFLADVVHVSADADGPFSLPSVAGFVGAFGFGGAIASGIIGGGILSLVSGVVVGLLLALPAAIGTMALARLATRMRTDATPTRADLVGRLGVVVTAIPSEGYGEVRVSLGGQPVKLNARSHRPVALGARVFVIEATSDTSVMVEETHSDIG